MLQYKVIPPISDAFFKELDATFKFAVEHIAIDATLSDIQRHVGQRQVVEWCRQHIRTAQVQGMTDPIVKPS
jgi:hypothetical protein